MTEEIKVTRPKEEEIKKKGYRSWPVWEKEVSTFDWSYDTNETCLILEGHAKVTPEKGRPAEFGPGDLVQFPKGMKCVWKIDKPIRKHYNFG